ncbi:MAG: hemolysin family protein [Bacteroidales bacterium]|jgi:putative hemolysin|nr:hemolysin family protein [Bacteroidales bacterium]
MEIVIIILLILINGFFSLSEIALVSCKRNRLERESARTGARIALKLLNNSEGFLSAVQVGITLIGIVTGVYGGASLSSDVAPLFAQFAALKPYAEEIAVTLVVVAITYVSIVIGELVPKTLALSNPEKIAIIVAPVIFTFSKIFFPFVKLLELSTNLLIKILGIRKKDEHITEGELRQMLKTASTEGVIEKEQNFLHEKVFWFSDKKAKHLMTPRTDLEWLDFSHPEETLQSEIAALQHTKIVCSDGNLDNFLGILDVHEFFRQKALGHNPLIKALLVQPLIIPENADAQRVLDHFRNEKLHICIVVNEYGGLEGVITMHDIMENFVGHITDATDADSPDIITSDNRTFIVNGDAPVETLAEVIENFTVNFDDIDYVTVAGFVFEQFSRIPTVGDTLVYHDCRIEVTEMDGNRIEQVAISKV